MSKGNQKRGQCDTCPAVKRVIPERIKGAHLNLCESCRLTISRLEREAAAKPENDVLAEDLEPVIADADE